MNGKIDRRFSDPSAGPTPWAVFRVDAAKVIAFAKAPHAQTTYS